MMDIGFLGIELLTQIIAEVRPVSIDNIEAMPNMPFLTLFPSSGCKFGPPAIFPLLRYGFCSKSEDVEGKCLAQK